MLGEQGLTAGDASYFDYTTDSGEVIKDIAWYVI